MSFQNLYYKRIAGTAKACFVCYRPTATVLATINTVDFLYTCDGHLNDGNFATKVKEVTAEEIAKLKEEWEEKQGRKKQKEKEAAQAEKDKKDDDKEKHTDKDKDKNNADKDKEKSRERPVTHDRYILHRDFFAMRQAEHKRRRQTAQAKELGPRLPGVPSGSIE